MKTTVKVRLALFVFALLFATSITRAEQPPQSIEKLSVADSNGKVVGSVLGFTTVAGVFDPVVAFTIQARRVVLAVGVEGFYSVQTGTPVTPVFFEATNCTGTPYVDSGTTSTVENLVPLSLLNSGRVYVLDGSPQTIFFKSVFYGFCETVPEQELTATPLRLLVDLNNFFTAPFSLK